MAHNIAKIVDNIVDDASEQDSDWMDKVKSLIAENNQCNELTINHIKEFGQQQSHDIKLLAAAVAGINDTVNSLKSMVETNVGVITPAGVPPLTGEPSLITHGVRQGKSQGLTTSNEVRPPSSPDLITSKEVRTGRVHPPDQVREDDNISVYSQSHASVRWDEELQNNTFVDHDLEGGDAVQEQETSFWEEGNQEYSLPEIPSGPEIQSTAAAAAKSFYNSKLDKEVLETKLSDSLIPKNCSFLIPKPLNKGIYTHKKCPGAVRASDKRLQDIQRIHSAAVTNVLEACGKLWQQATQNPAVRQACLRNP